MDKIELAEIIEKHVKWVKGEKGGELANLSGADLRFANLSCADLSEADLRFANLSCADLSFANLRFANLSFANLSEADLRFANLRFANLRGADLRFANLRGADLRFANLRFANLRGADLRFANLRGADLRFANLRCANLREANLSGANLSGFIYNEATSFFALQCPEEGSFIAWKKCRESVIVKLLIPESAKRSSATTRKCRASEAVVLDVFGFKYGVSKYNKDFVYRKHETVKPDLWDDNRWNECGGGIHFFITRREAELHE